jgi:hypothetical protein
MTCAGRYRPNVRRRIAMVLVVHRLVSSASVRGCVGAVVRRCLAGSDLWCHAVEA